MKLVRTLIFKLLGLKGYLRLVSRIYLRLVLNGFLKKKYPELFYLKQIIKPGFICIDIGANLGYYSTFMSKLSGVNGKVFAVEPVPLFTEVWKKNVRLSHIDNLTLLPYALGAENKKVKMGLPVVDGVLHHGMTKVVESAPADYMQYFECEMRVPDELFSAFDRLDFIKCDVEGYEQFVFANLTNTLKKFRPMIQCELGGDENRKNVIRILEGLNYKTCLLKNNVIGPATANEKQVGGTDFYFLPQ